MVLFFAPPGNATLSAVFNSQSIRMTTTVSIIVFCLVAALVCGSATELHTAGEPNDDSDWVDIVPLADAGIVATTPSTVGRVGLWTHGDSFESDKNFFDVEDRRFAVWFTKLQKEQQRKKMEEMNERRSRDAKTPGGDKRGNKGGAEKKDGDNGATTSAAITLRSTNRRRVMDSSSNPLHTKFKALQVDVRSTFKRLLRALGVANHTFTAQEKEYQDVLSVALPRSTQSSSQLGDRFDRLLQSYQVQKNTSTKNSSKLDNTTSATFLESAVSWVQDFAERYFLVPTVPHPLLLDDDAMKLFDMEADMLAADAKNLDLSLQRAESGLHDTEKKLREVRMQKAQKEDEEEEAASQRAKLPASADSMSEQQRDIRRRQEERMSKYTEMRTSVTNEVFGRIQCIRAVLKRHRMHQFHILQAAAELAPQQLVYLRSRKADLQKQMSLNDESSQALRKALKALSKQSKLVGSHIQEWEAIEKAASSVARRRITGAPLSVINSAIRWNAILRTPGALEVSTSSDADEVSMSVPAMSIIMQLFGLSVKEAQDLLLIPLLSSILLSFVVGEVSKWTARGLMKLHREVERRHARRAAQIRPKDKENEVSRFDARVFVLAAGVTLTRCACLLNHVVAHVCPQVAPIVCVLFMEGMVLRRESRTNDLGLPLSLLYRATHLITPMQRLLQLGSVVAVIGVNTLLNAKHIAKRPSQTAAVGRRLGRK